MTEKKRLGELLVQDNTVSQDTINDALRVQVGGNRRLGHILLRMGALTEDQLTKTLSQQLKIPLTDPAEAFTTEAKHLMPRYLCNKYGVLPLAVKNNNIMLTAMADPSDQEAIADIEHYTAKVVEPCLSKSSEIDKAIKQHIPYSIKDFFNPQANTAFTRIAATAALCLTIALGIASYNYIHTAQYGKISQSGTTVIYEHNDLMVGFDSSNGKVSLLGHSAFSDGYYSVSFANKKALSTFLVSKKSDFSIKQNQWLDWVMTQASVPPASKGKLAKL